MTLISVIESMGAGLGWEGNAGHGGVGTPGGSPCASLKVGFALALGTQGVGKAGTSTERAALESRGGRGRAVQARETARKIEMQGAFFGKQQASPVRGWLLGLGGRVRCAGCWVRGWAGCFLQIRGRRIPPTLPPKHPFVVGAQSRCSQS